jgi:acid phosphatase type 7
VKAASLLVLGIALAAGAVMLAQGAGSEDDDSAPSPRTTSAETEPSATGRAVASVRRPRAVVWAVGDGGTDTPEAIRVARSIAQGRADRLLYLGDVYPEGTAADFEENYEPTYGRLAPRTAPTPGNHEAPTADEGYYPYWEQALGASLPPYYSFRVGRWQILSLNSEIDYDPGSPQLGWLDRQVASGGNCRIAFWHRPRFSAGTHHGDATPVEPLWDALQGRARIVLSGHEHGMQRFRPSDGITQFISGAGGADLSPVDESDPRLRFANDSTYGALRLRLHGRQARHAFLTPSGRVLDRGTIRCGR